MAAPPAVMSLVTPTPACTGGTDCERRPTRTVVDREARLHGIAIRAGAAAVVVVPLGDAASAGAHHDGLMAAGRISCGRHRHEAGTVVGMVVALLAGLIPSYAIGSLLALVVGLVDGLGTSRLRGCWGSRHRGADRKRLDWVALIRPIVMGTTGTVRTCRRRATNRVRLQDIDAAIAAGAVDLMLEGCDRRQLYAAPERVETAVSR